MKRLSIVVVTLAVLVCAPARAAEPAPATTIPEGVVIGNVPVGGLTAESATEYVRAQFALPLVVGYGTYVLEAQTESLAVPSIQKAVQQALVAAPNTVVPLTVTVREARAARVHRRAQRALRAQARRRQALPAKVEAVDRAGAGRS